jgi:very-short-patch-repair endonuclease
VTDAARLGARVDCVSLLHLLGVFVFDHRRLHVQLTTGDSRLPARPDEVVGHWRGTTTPRQDLFADLLEAIVRACLCQTPRMAVATLDSAWHLGLIDRSDVAEIFRRLPRRYRAVRKLLDARAESGSETIVRLMLRGLGCRIDVQPSVRGVGRVDFIVDGWLIVECDSKAFHSDWEAQRRDRRRDRVAATLGFATLRLMAEEILYEPEAVLACLRGVLSAHNSSRCGVNGRG